MGFKCLPQITGLVRGEPQQGSNHRANGKKILQELGRERYSRSVTLDRSRSNANVYDECYKGSGTRCWNAMMQDADDYRITGIFQSGKRKGELFSRALRSDAVIGWSMIINPPHDATLDWNESDFERFYEDSFSVLSEIQPKLFRKDNIRITAIHRDEGVSVADEHMHIAGDALDEDGRYCGNLIDPALYSLINERYPEMMRDRGWDIEDCDRTDFKRCGTDAAYRQERNQKRHQQGRSVTKYVADKQKAAAQALEDAQKAAEAILKAANDKAEEIQQQAIKDAERASKAILSKSRSDADRITETAMMDADRIRQKARNDANMNRQFSDVTAKILARQAEHYRDSLVEPLPEVYQELITAEQFSTISRNESIDLDF